MVGLGGLKELGRLRGGGAGKGARNRTAFSNTEMSEATARQMKGFVGFLRQQVAFHGQVKSDR